MKRFYALLLVITFLTAQVTLAKNELNYPGGFTTKTNGGISFTENKGQIHDQNYKARPDVLFGGTDGNLVFHLKNNGISYQLNRIDSWKETVDERTKDTRKEIDKSTIYRLDINWLSVTTNPTIIKGKAFEGFNNYYLESCPNGALNVQSFENVTYQNIYTGIDLKWYQHNGHLKYDYLVAAGANYKNIQLQFSGATSIKLNSKGELVVTTPLGEIIEQAPLVIQNDKTLNAKWVIQKNNTISFDIQNINPYQAFVIDPAIRTWGTYYGGIGANDYGTACITDATGNVYMAGYTDSNAGTVIATTGAHQTINGGSNDAFIVKFNSTGIRQWGTYYGGTGLEYAFSCAVDATNNVYLAGYTYSGTGTVIATAGAHQPVFGGGIYDTFLAKFNSSGVRQWGTYYGGAGDEIAYGCSTDATGNVYLVGYTGSNTGTVIATAGAHQSAFGGGSEDAFIAKFNSSGVRQWGTYYGGIGFDRAYSCTNDATGNLCVTGHTDASTGTIIATTGAHQSAYGGGGGSDAFLVKFNASGVRQWGTYYGDIGNDQGRSCASDASGNIYLAGFTDSNTGTAIATPGSHQPLFGGGTNNDAFLVKFDALGIRQWGTYYGGTAIDMVFSCALDGSGNPYISGSTRSNTGTVIATPGSHQFLFGGGAPDDAFLVKFNTAGVRQWGTYYGGAATTDVGSSCAVDAAGNIYLSGNSASSTGTIIATSGSHQSTYGGGSRDAFLVQFLDCNAPANPTGSNQSICALNNSTLSATSGTAAINWYATPSSTTVLGTGTTYITPTLSTGTYTYYAEAVTCAPSATRTAIILTVNPTPTITVNSGGICIGSSFTIAPGGAGTYTIQGGSAVVSPTSNTNYTVVGTSTAGCVSANTATSNVTVNSLPLITVSSGSICSGQSFTIIPSGAGTYTIQGGSAIVSPTSNASYTVVGTSTAGCVSANTATSNVTVNTTPTISVNSGSICSGNSFTITPSGANTYTIQGGSAVVSPTATTNYTVAGTSTAGCVSSSPATSNLTVVTTPIINAGASQTITCSNPTVNLNGTGVSTYTWSGPGIVSGGNTANPIVNTSGSYSVSGSSGGCNSNTATVTVTSNTIPPSISATTSNSIICGPPFQGTATLTANGASTYTWNTLATTASISVSPSITTQYSVTGTNATNGCTNTAVFTQSVSTCTGVQQLGVESSELGVYPNPFNTNITITSNGTKQAIIIFTVLGSVVYNGIIENEKTELDLSNQASGIYFIRIGNIIKKIIKE